MRKNKVNPNKQRIPSEVLDELLEQWGGPAGLLGSDGLLTAMTGALVERAMEAEMDHHLGYESGDTPPEEQANRRNGATPKGIRTSRGKLKISTPRDREGTFQPELIAKHQRDFDGFDDQILSMYSMGMSTRDIAQHLKEIYKTDVSPDLISRVTDSVVDELKQWQGRPLESVYAIVYVDALVVKIRDKGHVQNKSVYIVVGLTTEGQKEVLGLWIQSTEGAKFWLSILSELKQRGVADILILCADGLTGLPAAVEAAFPRTIFQTCIVHLIRSSTRYVPWKDRKAVCADLRQVYTAHDPEAALEALTAFEETWGEQFPMVVTAWRERWAEVTPFLAFPAEIRRAIYTTNTIEALNRQIRKGLKTKGNLPTDESALKLIFLTIRNAKKWMRPAPYWNRALLQLAIHFPDRLPR